MLIRILLAQVILLLSTSGRAAELSLLTEDYPPFNFEIDGEVAGIATDILKLLVDKAELKASYKMLPWARAQMMAQQAANTCIYSAVRNPEREARYKWIGPLVVDDMTLFTRIDHTIALHDLQDAKQYRVGGYIGDAYTKYVEAQGVPVEISSHNRLNLRKLMAKRIDFWVAGSLNGRWLAKKEGLSDRIKPALQFGNPSDGAMWLACHPATDHATLVKLAEALKQAHENGSIDQILHRYR
ncbi:transporter substrate-binding domain-containing protein [Chitinivorax sp. B]|uniref:substrate-binding periplasmic protein n=1 Tax=Chitinivorax sp. B TaxID=2502235 RepID=UPI0014857A9A|nr:transporter substrate-binding domain-containing protein [Chitinivorax sp. B]